MLLTLLLLSQSRPEALHKMEQWIQKAKTLTVQIKLEAEGLPAGKATFALERPSKYAFRMLWADGDYRAIGNGGSTIEYDASDHTYIETKRMRLLEFPDNEVAQEHAIAFPFLLTSGRIADFVPAGAVFSEKQLGDGAEQLESKWGGEERRGWTRLTVAKDGKLLKWERLGPVGDQIVKTAMTFSNYVIGKPIPSSTFNLEPAAGWVPYWLPLTPAMLEVDSQARLGQWTSRTGKQDLTSQVKGSLLVITQPDCEPGKRLLALLPQLRKAAPRVLVLNLGPTAAGVDFWAPNAAIADKVREMGTPLMMWIDSKGVLKHLWLGFDPDQQQKVLKDVAAAAKGNPE